MATPKTKTDILILTPTYNRAEALTSLVSALSMQAEQARLRIIHIVVNDASTQGRSEYKRIESKYLIDHPYAVLMRWNQQNNGVSGFWKTVNKLFSLAKGYDFDLSYMIQDDAVPCERFFERTREAFGDLQNRDESICALNIVPCMLQSWGTSRYLDGFYVADRRLFETLKWKLYEPKGKWIDNFGSGSGVGSQVTRRLLEADVSVAPNQDVSWLNLTDDTSVMFPKRRPCREWVRQNFIDKEAVVCLKNPIRAQIPN